MTSAAVGSLLLGVVYFVALALAVVLVVIVVSLWAGLVDD